jgi:hypothetical protein
MAVIHTDDCISATLELPRSRQAHRLLPQEAMVAYRCTCHIRNMFNCHSLQADPQASPATMIAALASHLCEQHTREHTGPSGKDAWLNTLFKGSSSGDSVSSSSEVLSSKSGEGMPHGDCSQQQAGPGSDGEHETRLTCLQRLLLQFQQQGPYGGHDKQSMNRRGATGAGTGAAGDMRGTSSDAALAQASLVIKYNAYSSAIQDFAASQLRWV